MFYITLGALLTATPTISFVFLAGILIVLIQKLQPQLVFRVYIKITSLN